MKNLFFIFLFVLPKAPAVITIGKIQAGVRENIIPSELLMSGTIRTLDYGMRDEIHQSMKKMISQIASAYGAKADINIVSQTLINYNDPELTKEMLPSLQRAAGANNVTEINWIMPAEDFSFGMTCGITSLVDW
jgi:metal-dependent amidase/aminoacylase/carboxypeptidase family protein